MKGYSELTPLKMKRSDFLKSLGLVSAGLLLPRSLAENQPIKIYDNYLAGLSHYDFKQLREKIAEGDEVALKRETTNAHDAFAVEVYWKDHKLGYLPAYENVVLANMLDARVELKAFVCKKDLKTTLTSALAVEVYANLLMPGKVLMENVQGGKRANDVVDIYRRGCME